MEQKVEKSCWRIAATAVCVFLVALFLVSVLSGPDPAVIAAATTN